MEHRKRNAMQHKVQLPLSLQIVMARRKRHGGLVGVHSEQRILNSVRTATTEGTGKVRQFLYVKGNNRIVRQDMVLN